MKIINAEARIVFIASTVSFLLAGGTKLLILVLPALIFWKSMAIITTGVICYLIAIFYLNANRIIKKAKIKE